MSILKELLVLLENEKPWEDNVPSKGKKMTPQQKARAKARAKKAGRPYPNLIDNMAVMKKAKK